MAAEELHEHTEHLAGAGGSRRRRVRPDLLRQRLAMLDATRSSTSSRLLELRGGNGDEDYDVVQDVFAPFDPRDSDDDALLAQHWEYTREDAASEEERRQRWEKLAKYGEALGVFDSEPSKEDWEPQTADEHATMRHGERPWTPKDIHEDWIAGGADLDEDSSYDSPNRLVPDVDLDHFEADPLDAWQTFRRQCERPGHISSHRSAYRRLPQYLRHAGFDEELRARRLVQRNQEKPVRALKAQMREQFARYADSVDMWMQALGEGEVERGERNLSRGGVMEERVEVDTARGERQHAAQQKSGEVEHRVQEDRFDALSAEVEAALREGAEAQARRDARATAIQKLTALENRVREIMSRWDLDGFPGYEVPEGGTVHAKTGAGSDTQPWTAYVPFTSRVVGEDSSKDQGEEGDFDAWLEGGGQKVRHHGIEEERWMDAAGGRLDRLESDMKQMLQETRGSIGAEPRVGWDGESSQEEDSIEALEKLRHGEDWKWEGRAKIEHEIAGQQAILRKGLAAIQAHFGIHDDAVVDRGATSGWGGELVGTGLAAFEAALEQSNELQGGGSFLAKGAESSQSSRLATDLQAMAGGGVAEGAEDTEIGSVLVEVERAKCRGRHRGRCSPWGGLCEELDHICGEPSLDQRLAAMFPNGLHRLPASLRVRARQAVYWKSVVRLRVTELARQQVPPHDGDPLRPARGPSLPAVPDEATEIAAAEAELEAELWERRARQEALSRLCLCLGGDIERMSYAMRHDASAPWQLHVAARTRRQRRRRAARHARARDIELDAVIHAPGLTVAFAREDSSVDAADGACMWEVSAPPWGNCSGTEWEEPDPDLLRLMGLYADGSARKEDAVRRGGLGATGAPPLPPSVNSIARRFVLGHDGDVPGARTLLGAGEEQEEEEGWEARAGVEDLDAHGPEVLACAHSYARFKPTRNSVLRLGPANLGPDGGASTDSSDEEVARARDLGVHIGVDHHIVDFLHGQEKRTWSVLTRMVDSNGEVEEVELTNPFNDALDADGDEADRRSSGEKIGDLASLREILRESLCSEAGALQGDFGTEAFAPLEFGQGDGRGLGTATSMVLALCCNDEFPTHPSHTQLFAYAQALRSMTQELRNAGRWHEWVGPYRLWSAVTAPPGAPHAGDLTRAKGGSVEDEDEDEDEALGGGGLPASLFRALARQLYRLGRLPAEYLHPPRPRAPGQSRLPHGVPDIAPDAFVRPSAINPEYAATVFGRSAADRDDRLHSHLQARRAFLQGGQRIQIDRADVGGGAVEDGHGHEAQWWHRWRANRVEEDPYMKRANRLGDASSLEMPFGLGVGGGLAKAGELEAWGMEDVDEGLERAEVYDEMWAGRLVEDAVMTRLVKGSRGAGGDWVSDVLEGRKGSQGTSAGSGAEMPGTEQVGAARDELNALTDSLPRRGGPVCDRHLAAAADEFGVHITTWEATSSGLRTHKFSPARAWQAGGDDMILLCAMGQHFWCAHTIPEEQLEEMSAARLFVSSTEAANATMVGEDPTAVSLARPNTEGQVPQVSRGRGEPHVKGSEEAAPRSLDENRVNRERDADKSTSEPSSDCDRGDSIFAEFGLSPDDAGWLEGLDSMLGGIRNWRVGPDGASIPPPDLPYAVAVERAQAVVSRQLALKSAEDERSTAGVSGDDGQSVSSDSYDRTE